MNREAKNLYAFGPFRFDSEERLLLREGTPVSLPPKITETLLLLLQNAGHIVEKDRLIRELWPDAFVEDGNLNKNISVLRKTLGQWDGGREYIETVPKRGYRFVAPVSDVNAAPSDTEQPPHNAQMPVSEGDGLSTSVAEAVAGSFAATISRPLSLPLSNGGHLSEPILGGVQAAPLRPTREQRRYWVLLGSGLAAFAFAALIAVTMLRPHAEPQPKLLGSMQITDDNRIKTRIVTDGVRLFFSEIRGGYRREWQADVGSETGYIGQVSAAGGETSYIPTPFTNVAVFDISRDGAQLLIGEWTGTEDEARIWVMPLPSGTPQRLGTILAHDGTFAPDGQHFVYACGSMLYSAKIDGSGVRQMVSVSGWPFQPRFSPDGRRIRFSVADTNTQWTSIWEMNSDGSQFHPFLAKSQLLDQQCCGNWSTDGKYYFFSGNTSHRWSDVWIYNDRMPRPVRLTTGPLGFFSPVPSADGKKLFVIGSHPRSELIRYDLKAHEFGFNLSGISADQVEYSRDGRWVTYVAFPEGSLWRSKSDGSEKLQLTSLPMIATLPAWSPDGKHIAFVGARPGMPWKLFMVSADGGTPKELLPDEHRDEMDPTWSPDGDTLAFGRRPGESGNFGDVEIMLLNMKTRHIAPLPGSRGMVGPRWAPQGRYLSAMTTDSQKITLFNFKTGTWNTVATGGFAYQNWSKDGEFIYFDTLFQSDKELLRIRIPGGKVEHLASLKGLDVGVGDSGAWNSVTPDGSPMLMRNIGTSEIYRLDVVLP